MRQTLTKAKHGFLQGNTKYEFIKADKDKWDVNGRILKNIKSGVESSDAATVKQTSVYDEVANKFIFNNTYFDLNNALVADTNVIPGVRKLDGSGYLPENYVFKDWNYIISSKGGRFILYKYEDGHEFRSRNE